MCFIPNKYLPGNERQGFVGLMNMPKYELPDGTQVRHCSRIRIRRRRRVSHARYKRPDMQHVSRQLSTDTAIRL